MWKSGYNKNRGEETNMKNYRSPLVVLPAIFMLSLGLSLLLRTSPTDSDVYVGLTSVNRQTTNTGDGAKLVIKAPEVGEIGELIRLDVSGSTAAQFKWLLVPQSTDFEFYDDGKHAVFSARKPGDYMFIVACGLENTVDVLTHVVKIVGPVPTPPDPNNTNYPVVARPKDGALLTAWIPYWCSQAQRSKEETLKLAASFDSVAATISAGINTTPQQIIEVTSKSNNQALGASIDGWIPVLQNIQLEMKIRAQAGTLTTPEQHSLLWREIADGLKAYAAAFQK